MYFVKFMMVAVFLMPWNVNAVYKCTVPQVKGSRSSGIVYSKISCASDAEIVKVEEPEWRKQQIEEQIKNKKLIKEAQEREALRIWKEQEPARRAEIDARKTASRIRDAESNAIIAESRARRAESEARDAESRARTRYSPYGY